MKKHVLWGVIGIFFLWRMSLFFVAEQADNFFSYAPTYAYSAILDESSLPGKLAYWAGFDGLHYLTVAQNGYVGTGLIQAFFPLFPAALAALKLFANDLIFSSILLSNLFALLAIIIFFCWLRSLFDTKIALLSVLALLAFPSSFFLGAVYNEGLFLTLVFISFWAGSKGKWWLAGITAAGASATRLVGIFLVPALLIEYIYLKEPAVLAGLKVKKTIQLYLKTWRRWTPILIGTLGLGGYMLYLWQTFGDPFYFMTVQDSFNTGRQTDLISLPQVYWRYLKILFTVPIDWKWYSYLQDIILTSITLLALAYAWFRSTLVRKSWLIFAIFAILIPTMTGTLSSMPRYVLVAFPLYILWAELVTRSRFWYSWLILSVVLLIINTMLFIQGQWVA